VGKQLAIEYLEPREGDVRHSLASVEAAAQYLGYRPIVSIGDGLKKTIEWYQRESLRLQVE
jgi:nucleoside-diphosphate-sugar epimerase